MITIAPAAAQIPALINEYGVTAHGNTYAVDYGRILGGDWMARSAAYGAKILSEEAAPETDPIAEALDEAVAARDTLVRWARGGNSPGWRKASRTAMQATDEYARIAGMPRQDAAAKVQEISDASRRR